MNERNSLDTVRKAAVELEYDAALLAKGARRLAWRLQRMLRSKHYLRSKHEGNGYLIVVVGNNVVVRMDGTEGPSVIGLAAARIEQGCGESEAENRAIHRVRIELREKQYFVSDDDAHFAAVVVEKVLTNLFSERRGFTTFSA